MIVDNMISVLMCNYNTDECYLRDAIESILNQTYQNFEFIIVDDCSTDGSADIISSYKDPRMILIKNETNLGLTKSLNKGLAVAKGEFIARMDSDDISYNTRFERQVEKIRVHANAIVCGTWVDLIGDGAEKRRKKTNTNVIGSNEEFRINLLFGNQNGYVHPSVMFNNRLLKKYGIKYFEEYPCAQDYRMWVECSRFGDCIMLEDIQFAFRLHDRSISATKAILQEQCARRIMEEQLADLHMTLSDKEYKIHSGLLTGRKEYSTEILSWIKKMIENNRKYRIYDTKIFEDILWKKWTETGYFGISKAKGIVDRMGVIKRVPLKYQKELFSLYLKRRKDQIK